MALWCLQGASLDLTRARVLTFSENRLLAPHSSCLCFPFAQFRRGFRSHNLNTRREIQRDPRVKKEAEVTQPRLFSFHPKSTQQLATLGVSHRRVSVSRLETPTISPATRNRPQNRQCLGCLCSWLPAGYDMFRLPVGNRNVSFGFGERVE